MMLLPRNGRFARTAFRQSLSCDAGPSERGGWRASAKILEHVPRARGIPARDLTLVLDVGLGTVAAGGGLGVPLAVGRFIFDRLGAAGHPLFSGGALGGGKFCGMGRKRFRKHAIDG